MIDWTTIKHSLYGLLIGDACGVLYEFKQVEQIPTFEEIDMIPPKNFQKTYPHIPPGTWSDDGAQALALLDSLLNNQRLDADDFTSRLVSWYEDGLYAVNSVVFDIGIQTSEALRAYQRGTPAIECGQVRPDGKGNGALMRVLPLALWHQGMDEELVHDAHIQTMVTHGHICNQVCSAIYVLWARYLLKGLSVQQAYEFAVETLTKIYQSKPLYEYELLEKIRPFDPPITDGSGFVISSLRAARIALEEPTYERVIKKAISFGHDTDTNAAIAGGLAGIIHPVYDTTWFHQLRGKEIVEQILLKWQGQLGKQ